MLEQVKEKAIARKANSKGFTLMELLIVIAIISVLVAIAIPTFTAQLDSAKDAADKANARALYALAQAEWMSDPQNTVETNFTWNEGDRKVIAAYGNGDSQAFTFSDRTSNVSVTFDSDRGAHVQLIGSANNGNGVEYPEG